MDCSDIQQYIDSGLSAHDCLCLWDEDLPSLSLPGNGQSDEQHLQPSGRLANLWTWLPLHRSNREGSHLPFPWYDQHADELDQLYEENEANTQRLQSESQGNWQSQHRQSDRGKRTRRCRTSEKRTYQRRWLSEERTRRPGLLSDEPSYLPPHLSEHGQADHNHPPGRLEPTSTSQQWEALRGKMKTADKGLGSTGQEEDEVDEVDELEKWMHHLLRLDDGRHDANTEFGEEERCPKCSHWMEFCMCDDTLGLGYLLGENRNAAMRSPGFSGV